MSRMNEITEPILELYITRDVESSMKKMCHKMSDSSANQEKEKTVQDIKGDCILYLTNIVNKVACVEDENVVDYVIGQANYILELMR